MPSEALRHIKTMRHVKTSLDIARYQKSRTTNSLSRTVEEAAHLLSLDDRKVGQILAKETQRFAAMEASVNRSRERVLKARGKLAVTINRNRALTELRYQLQKARSEGKNTVPLKKEPLTQDRKKTRMELNY